MGRKLSREQQRLAHELFHQVVDLSPESRCEVLDREARDMPEIREEVKSLLFAAANAESFLEHPPLPGVLPLAEKGAGGAFQPGDRVGDFLIERELGAGAFATVYLAAQTSLNRQVALKVSVNFGEEARTMAPLEHDHIVKVFSEDVDKAKNLRLLCMQYVPGLTLEKLLSELPADATGSTVLEILDRMDTGRTLFDPIGARDRERIGRFDLVETALWIGKRLAEALAYAHEHDVLHLDVKPGNVLITPYGRPLLTDFNIAIRRNPDGTLPAVLGGTEHYMSPEHRALFKEQVGGQIDHRADIFSLGILLREWLKKAPAAEVTSDIEHALSLATQHDPGKRYTNARELAHTLESCLELRSIKREFPTTSPLIRWLNVHSLWAVAMFTLLPQILGSFFNISYNAILIVQHLTPAQQRAFHHFILIYNCFSYPVCTTWLIRELLPLINVIRGPETLFDESPKGIDRLRRSILELPLKIVAVTMLGWMPGSILFPFYIDWKTGPVSSFVYFHFFVSFTISGLLAMSYSAYYLEFLVLQVVYPRLWWSKSQIRKAARAELSAWAPRLSQFHYMAAFLPLIAAIVVVMVGPGQIQGPYYRVYQILVTGLLISGMLGFFIGIVSARVQSRTLLAFTGLKAEEVTS